MWGFSGSKKDGGGGTALVERARSARGAPAPQTMPPDPAWGGGFDDPHDDEPEHYVTRPVRPIVQTAARVGLWTAVGLGALGGIVSLVDAAQPEKVPEVPEIDEGIGVPAPVAGVAENAVAKWLTASEDTENDVNALFVEPPVLDDVDTELMEVVDVTSVAGLRLEEGYWSVTVAARVVELVGDVPPPPTTWYVEIGIVGDVEEGLAALTTPAIVPPPVLRSSPWQTAARNVEPPDPDDRIANTVEGFLNALLAGRGDPGRYLAPRVEIPAIDPPPFAEARLTGLSVEELEEGEVRIWALAELETAAETVHVVGYEIKARQRIDRWEILSIWGAPAVDSVPPPDEDDESGTSGGPGAAGGTASTTEPPAEEEETTSTTTSTTVGPGE